MGWRSHKTFKTCYSHRPYHPAQPTYLTQKRDISETFKPPSKTGNTRVVVRSKYGIFMWRFLCNLGPYLSFPLCYRPSSVIWGVSQLHIPPMAFLNPYLDPSFVPIQDIPYLIRSGIIFCSGYSIKHHYHGLPWPDQGDDKWCEAWDLFLTNMLLGSIHYLLLTVSLVWVGNITIMVAFDLVSYDDWWCI